MLDPGQTRMSVIVILRLNKQLKDGTYPIAIQIIKNRKPAIIHLGYSVKLEEWDDVKKSVRNLIQIPHG